MSVNSDMAESLRREKARNLRYKKAIHADLNLASIGSKLMEMYESASDVLYWCENDGESTQLDELIGDEEETYELRMAFSTLEGDCQQMLDDLDNEWVPEFFDDFFGGISPRGSMMLGFDSYEGDYFGLDDRYERGLAQKECVKRLMAHTKAEIIEAYAVIRRAIFDDGILTGCDLSYSGSTLTMTAGQLMICGRQIIHPSSQNWAVTEATSGYARLVLTIDVTRTSTKDTFDQVVDEIQYATDANGFADLTTADINATGTRYQVAVCVVSLGPGGITGIASKLDMTEGGGAGGVLTVTVIPGELVTVYHGDKSQTKAANASGVAVFKGLKAGAWTVAVTRNGKPTAKTVIIVTDYSVSIPLNTIPEFTYTGDYEIVNDSDEPITVSQDNWKIRFLTSGTLTFTNLNGAENGIDVFLVGGGGNGETIRGARGGGGGYTKTVKGVSIAISTPYTVTIGASSGTSSAFGASANGASGANGGSGGGGGGSSSGTPGNGGSNGGNGTAGNVSGGGTGQGTTTREFGESTGKLYSGGGGGSAANAGAAGDSTAGAGAAYCGAAKNGVANTGGGGGAAYGGTAGAGGSGIVIIRNVRGAA